MNRGASLLPGSELRSAILILVAICIILPGCGPKGMEKEASIKLEGLQREFGKTAGLSTDSFQSLKALQSSYPDSDEINEFYKQVLLARKDWNSLESLLSKQDRKNLTGEDQRILAIAYNNIGNFEKSLVYVAPLMEESPGDVELRTIAATAELSLGRTDKAAKLLDDVWKAIVERQMSEEITLRGIIYLRQDNPNQAVETFQKVLEFQPDNISANYNLGKAYQRLGNQEKAEESLAKATAGQKTLKANTYRRSVEVKRTYELEEAWKKKDYDNVIRLAELMVPTTTEKSKKIILYQYIYESYKAQGMSEKAEEARRRAALLAK